MQYTNAFEWERYGYLSQPCSQLVCLFPNKKTCSWLLDQIQHEKQSYQSLNYPTTQPSWHFYLVLVLSSQAISTFHLKVTFLDYSQRKRERITKVLMLQPQQHQTYQQEFQAMVSTFITQYAHLTGFLDSWFYEWSRLVIPLKLILHG